MNTLDVIKQSILSSVVESCKGNGIDIKLNEVRAVDPSDGLSALIESLRLKIDFEVYETITDEEMEALKVEVKNSREAKEIDHGSF
jgi:hypothetical protein